MRLRCWELFRFRFRVEFVVELEGFGSSLLFEF